MAKRHMIPLRYFHSFLAPLLLALPGFSAPASPPNVIMLLVDDMGYGDIGAFRFDDSGLTAGLR